MDAVVGDRVVRQLWVDGADLEAERERARGERATDPAEADDSQPCSAVYPQRAGYGVIKTAATNSGSAEDVEAAAVTLESHAAKYEAFRREIGRIANTIIDGGKLENYGTPRAREYLRKWAKDYGRSSPAEKKDKQ